MTKPKTRPAWGGLPLRALPDWTLQAACDGIATAGFDPWHPPEDDDPEREPGTPGQAAMFSMARRVCKDCPVRLDCARRGLELLEVTGVRGMFGGLTPTELRRLARRLGWPSRKVAQHGTRSKYTAGCHCDLCKMANARDEHTRRLEVAS